MAWRLYSSSEAARILGISPDTLRRWRDAGRGPAYILVGSRYKYEHSELESYMRRRRNA
ncbi:helix-turn-helix domain-containing protein [Bifidobacterium choerinum]|uniref:helix-turn-helix domain-containing protein n=1 Tax=Bifidobacterium choerinum TaxID=35760 RepID=UPI000C180CAC